MGKKIEHIDFSIHSTFSFNNIFEFDKLKFSPYFFSFIFITIIGANNAVNTTNNHVFPVKIL